MVSPVDIAFYAAPEHLRRTGLVAYVRFSLAGLTFQGLALRRTLDGRHVLSWPRLRMEHGNVRCAVRPRDDAARRALEAPVIEAARRAGVLP